MAASLPISLSNRHSHFKPQTELGHALPGMIDEPGSFSGIVNSPKPQRGPDANQRTSLAILFRLPASVLSAPEANTSASRAASASNLFGEAHRWKTC